VRARPSKSPNVKRGTTIPGHELQNSGAEVTRSRYFFMGRELARVLEKPVQGLAEERRIPRLYPLRERDQTNCGVVHARPRFIPGRITSVSNQHAEKSFQLNGANKGTARGISGLAYHNRAGTVG